MNDSGESILIPLKLRNSALFVDPVICKRLNAHFVQSELKFLSILRHLIPTLQSSLT
jgi:hypothetical protein